MKELREMIQILITQNIEKFNNNLIYYKKILKHKKDNKTLKKVLKH